jgi:hypothetical protein
MVLYTRERKERGSRISAQQQDTLNLYSERMLLLRCGTVTSHPAWAASAWRQQLAECKAILFFLTRRDRSLEAMRFIAGMDSDGFRYVSNLGAFAKSAGLQRPLLHLPVSGA